MQINIDEIVYIESAGNYSKVVLQRKMITVREKISDLLSSLPDGDFMQVHKSFAVAKKHIGTIEGNRIFLYDYVIPIGKMYKLNVAKLIK